MQSRTEWVDYAKALGIILVVYGHVVRGLSNANMQLPTLYTRLIDSIVYSFHMPLFFFLSGLFFYQSFLKRGPSEVIFSKVDTIFYPYVLWSIIQGSLEIGLSTYTNGNVSLAEIFSLLWNPRAQFWFLYTLFLIFIISSIIYKYGSKKYSLIFFILASVLYICSPYLSSIKLIKFIAENFVFFIFGIIFYRYIKIESYSSKIMLFSLLFIFILSQWFFHQYLMLGYKDRGAYSLLLALVSILFIVSLSVYLSSNRYLGFLTVIGSSSMAIYLMHIMAGSGARIVIGKLFGIELIAVHIVCGVLIGVLVPLFSLKLINKLKVPYLFSAPISKLLKS